jgi:hypothetical protein
MVKSQKRTLAIWSALVVLAGLSAWVGWSLAGYVDAYRFISSKIPSREEARKMPEKVKQYAQDKLSSIPGVEIGYRYKGGRPEEEKVQVPPGFKNIAEKYWSLVEKMKEYEKDLKYWEKKSRSGFTSRYISSRKVSKLTKKVEELRPKLDDAKKDVRSFGIDPDYFGQ